MFIREMRVYMRNLHEQVKKAFCFKNCSYFQINCFSDHKIFANSQPPALNFKSFCRSLEHFFFLMERQNNFGNKIPFLVLENKS